MIGFIIGNGKGRKDFDLFSLKDKGIIVGCNALYRDPNPAHYIVSIDPSMATELKDCYEGNLIVQQDGLAKDGKANTIVYRPKFRNKARSSGGLATDYAINAGATSVYWIGFDNPKRTVFKDASMYGGSKNYNRNNSWGYSCFIDEYKTILQHHKDIQFTSIIKPGVSNDMLDELGKFTNYSVLSYEQFNNFLESCPCSSVDLEHMATNYSVGGSNPSKGST